ncbi:MAG: hypothetical protein A2511_06545 [Deltaproteobacteria bacterium RIFOXYD12_FULL_50_9]|nr:MAG: hypothetical protein A2511_06545 [Deltaproteobacteria bacterium RIFOXYD12_FULL_50_9]
MNLLRWRQLASQMTLIIVVYSLLRFFFFLNNQSLFSGVTVAQVGLAFLIGLRFDLAAVCIINIPFLLLTILTWYTQPGGKIEGAKKIVFITLNAPFLIINLVDLEYIKFTGRRSDMVLLKMVSDPGVKLTTLALQFWPIVLLGLALLGSLSYLYSRTEITREEAGRSGPWWSWVASAVAVIAMTVVAARGGVQSKPISLINAAIQNHSGLTQLTLNSSFTLMRSSGKQSLAKLNYFADRQELRNYLRSYVAGENMVSPSDRHDNLVLIIVESLATEYMAKGNGGKSYTPFLDTLTSHSLYLRNNYANGRRSIEALPSILAGLPSMMNESFSESRYCDNQIPGLGSELTASGYETSFFHGARKGTMRFDAFCRQAGFRNYFSMAEYPDRADYDGDWGIYDEPYLQYVVNRLSGQTTPFASVVFTLSSHVPYPIPKQYQDRFPKGTLPIHESIGYTDYALERFFASARQQPWYPNTLFVITSDHVQELETPEFLTVLGHHRVPLLFFHPTRKFPPINPDQITQHADILPSILDFLHIQPKKRLLFGRSLFRLGEGRAIMHEAGHYWLVKGEHALEFVPPFSSRIFDLANDPLLKSPLANEPVRLNTMEKETKALMQYFNNGLLEHKLDD